MILIIIQAIILTMLSPLCVGIVRKIKAFMQNRQGAAITQPYFDLWKLFHKDEVIAHDASWIFTFSPFIIFSISIVIALGIPFIMNTAPLHGADDYLVIIYLFALMTFFLALAGMDTGSMFGGFGASREMTLAALTEGTLLFSILPVALITHTTNITLMIHAVTHLPFTAYFPILIAFLGFFIAMLSETGRIPFDNPATHLELTMIHEAMILEYSGKRLALIEWASANKLLFFIILGANIFFPWSLPLHANPLTLFSQLLFVLLKILIFLIVIAVLESSIAKFRMFRLPDILLTGLICSIIALIATVIS